MIIARFGVFLIVFIMALSGGPGGCIETAHHDEDRCLICENAAHPAKKPPNVCSLRLLKAFVPQSIVLLEETLEQIAFCTVPLFENSASTSHFRILLI